LAVIVADMVFSCRRYGTDL